MSKKSPAQEDAHNFDYTAPVKCATCGFQFHDNEAQWSQCTTRGCPVIQDFVNSRLRDDEAKRMLAG